MSYAPPADLELHKFYVIGDWLNLDGSMKLVSETGTIKLLYVAKQVNIVTEDTANLEIILDENPLLQEHAGTDITPGTNILQTSDAGLYNIISSDASSLHTLEIKVTGKDFQMFTFTFG